MDKKTLRKNAIEQRNNLTKSQFWQLNEELLEKLSAFDWLNVKCLHLFLPITEKKEIDTFEFIHFFKTQYPHIKLVVSRNDLENNTINPVLFDPEHTVLIKNKYNIPEPLYGEIIPKDEIDAVIVPLLTFDKEGHRVGYGAGFYDRFLSKCKPDVLKIGVSLFDPVEKIIDTHPFDIKLTHCICPKQTFTF